MNREAEKIDFEYATAYLQAKDITGSVVINYSCNTCG